MGSKKWDCGYKENEEIRSAVEKYLMSSTNKRCHCACLGYDEVGDFRLFGDIKEDNSETPFRSKRCIEIFGNNIIWKFGHIE